ncbi:MAG TPA: tRNA lysidine(34) synthetase TilS [Burkholderiales bacterium]|nr:tRNA lysidine(34) synthetase TilS [Burkholderiales bacterium]
MAASRKPPNVDLAALAALRGKRVAVGLSGGLDSVVLLHLLHGLAPRLGFRLSAVHVNHGLSANAGEWQKFCQALCLELDVPFKALRVSVRRRGHGLEAAARDARRAALARAPADAIALAHHLDDQAETVLFNLLRGAGRAGASGMAPVAKLGRKTLLRPLLGVPRSAIRAYAARERLAWIEDESNADESLTRNFLRRRVGPLLETRFPRWRESLARAARHFAAAELDAQSLLRAYLKGKGLRAPSEAKLLEMLKQMGAGRGAIEHDGMALRLYRKRMYLEGSENIQGFESRAWNGEAKLELAGGELRFRKVRGSGIDPRLVERGGFEVRRRSGGERLQPDPARPRRTLKNLFQEAGIPPWQRERLPLLYCGADLVWVPGIGVDAKYASRGRAAGILPEWSA